MSDISGFLRVRGVPEEAISFMEEQKGTEYSKLDDFPAETWKAIGRILLKGYQDCQYLPNKLALPFLELVLVNSVYSDLKVHFLQFVSRDERDILMQAMSDFSTADCDDLVEILDSYGCRKRITAKTLPTILDEIAHKELGQKPMFVIDCWRDITHHHLFLCPEALIEFLTDLQPTSKKVSAAEICK